MNITKVVLSFVALVLPIRASLITSDGSYSVSGSGSLVLNSMSGSTNGVLVNLGSGSQPSGPISFSLDPSKTSTFTVDFDADVMTLDFNLLVTFPLQGALAIAPVPIEVVESGPISPFNIILGPTGTSGYTSPPPDIGAITQPLLPAQSTSGSSSGSFAVPSSSIATFLFDPTDLSGGGSVTTGPFSGFGYSNDWSLEAEAEYSVSGPGGTKSVSGSISITTNTPEPSSFMYVVLGTVALALVRSTKIKSRCETQ
jgi:hypothetical protein